MCLKNDPNKQKAQPKTIRNYLKFLNQHFEKSLVSEPVREASLGGEVASLIERKIFKYWFFPLIIPSSQHSLPALRRWHHFREGVTFVVCVLILYACFHESDKYF